MNFSEWVKEEEKKKKKQQEETQQNSSLSFSEWVNAEYGLQEDNPTMDIAPVRSDRGKADLFGLDLFQESEGNVVQGILGTVGDLGLEVVKGAGGLVEGVTDLILYGAAGVADAFGGDKIAENWRENAKKNEVNALTQGADDFLEKYSYAGNTLDAVAQGVGQVGTLIATGGLASTGAGATMLTTGLMGASGVGSGMSEAYEGGATDDEALTYGLISGAADAVTEMIFGGLGKGVNALGFGRGLVSADDMLAKTVSNKFKSQIGKNLAEFGIKAGAEGLEEVLAGFTQAIGKKATYMSEEDFDKILADENLFEQFVVGGLTSGIAQSGSVRTSIKTGRDFVTGLTQNEQTVVDSLYESEIADKNLDKKEKQKIYDQILTKLDKGYISVGDIESTLGGETYKAYKDTLDSETALKDKLKASQKEYNELKGIHWREKSAEQFERMDELETEIKNLEAQVKETTANSKLGEMKSQLSKKVFELTKNDTKLQESYREEMRRGQDLELDVEKYKGAAKITAQNLLKGGMNNTNRVHDVVNFLTKLSADKNIVFDVATAKKLADAGLAVDGKQVNGVITKDGIVLNLESSAVLETTVGHEITHALEGTEHYEVLKNVIKEYAELKGVYADKYSSLESIYSKKDADGNILKDENGNTVWIRDDVDIDSEVVADLVGEYLFTDADFINNLSVKHRNVFQKVYDEIKYLVKVATAGSEEARKLEEVKRAFDKAYKEDAEVDTAEYADSEVKYSIREEAPPKETGIAYKVFFVKDGKLYPPMVANPDGADTPMGVWLNADVGKSAPPSKTGRQQVKAGGKGTQGGGGSLAFRPGWHLGDLPRASQFDRVNPETGKKELFPENFVWAEVEYAKDVDYQEEAMSYGYTENGKFRHAYAGLPRLPENGYYRYRTNPKPDTVPWIITGAMKVNRLLSDAEVNEILAKNGLEPVHRQGGDVGLEKFGIEGDVKYSLSANAKSDVHSALVDKNYVGEVKLTDTSPSILLSQKGVRNLPMVMNASHIRENVFTEAEAKAKGLRVSKNINYHGLGEDLFLKVIDDLDNVREAYRGTKNADDPERRENYFLLISQQTDKDGNVINVPVFINEKGVYNRVFIDTNKIATVFGRSELREYIKQQIAKGNLVRIKNKSTQASESTSPIKADYGMGASSTENVARLPKNVKGKFSLTTDSDGRQLSKEQAEYFKNSKVVDENGNLLVMYHGTPNGDYSVFKSGTYFTANKEYADRYQNPGASSISTGKTASAPKTFAVYLDIKKPFDLNDAEARRIYIEDYIKGGNALGINPYLSDAEYEKITTIDWTEGEDLRDFLVDNGYDYDGLVLDEGADGGYGDAVESRGKSYVIFTPEQVKNIDNAKPTADPDIRFSLSEAVEETKDLVALHNLTESKLTKSLELGGLPMPSLAVTKSDIPHDNFGEITLIFGKETIDPKANKKNKVYSADAWTPTFPRVEYEADSEVVRRISHKLSELGRMVDDEFERDLSRIGYSIEDYLDRQGGEEGLIQYVMDNYGLKAAYLEDIGKHTEKITQQQEVPRNFNPASADKYHKVMDILGVNTAEEIYDVNLKEARDNHGADLEAVFPGITKSALRMGKVLGMVGSYLKGKDSPIEYKTVTDSGAMRKAVDDALDAEGFEAWVRDLFSGVVKDSGIYNNKDLFTPSGNRRTFKQTHLPVTLENIVKAMASQNDGNSKNVSGFNGVKTLRATTAETFKSIDEMHKRKGRLQHLTQEQADEITEALQTRLLNAMTAIDNENEQRGDTNPYIRLDQIGETIAEISENGKYDVADIQNTFRQYRRTVSDDTAQAVKQLLYDVSQMPVNIFEAKPQRVVSFDEAKVFVIPNNVDAKLKQELLGRGYSIAEYDPNVEGDRNRVVNQYEEYKFSLSDPNDIAPVDFRKSAKYLMVDKSIAQDLGDIAPVAKRTDAPVATDDDEISVLRDKFTALEERLTEMANSGEFGSAFDQLAAEWSALKERIEGMQTDDAEAREDVPLETEDTVSLTKKLITDLARDVRGRLGQPIRATAGIRKLIEEYSESPNREKLFSELKEKYGTYTELYVDDTLAEAQKNLRTYGLQVGDYIKKDIADYESVRKRNRYKIKFSDTGTPVDMLYYELNEQYPHLFPSRIDVPADQFERIVEVANMEIGTGETRTLTDGEIWEATDSIVQSINEYKYAQREKAANKFAKESFESLLDAEKPPKMPTRSEVHKQIIDGVKTAFSAKGFDFDEVLRKAKNLSTFATVDNTPQRVMEKALGYKEGQILSNLTVNKVAQNETEGIKWLNSITNRKNGLLAELSKRYNIKPGSNESAAAQMYAEGFYVNDNNEIIAYGDAELAKDFPDAQVQRNIKGLASDPRIRQFYDETLAMINESRTRNAYPEIPRLDNYFLHFRAMDDTFSKLGLPFNPNDIRAKDLPTDLNGVTADLKPGQPYFASAMHRKGKRTSFDLLGGLERYATSAKNQIYHIDDIQNLRALRNYLADNFGQAHGLESIDTMSEEEAQQRIDEVFNSHLSTFAKFLNEEANVLAGKTALIDRGLEGIIGRRGITFLDTLNKQVGSNMIGWNVSSALTNFDSVVRAFAKTNKYDFLKAFTQFTSNKIGSAFGKGDGFAENNPTIVRRNGADRFYRTPWQKAGDAGYVLMGAVDNISTELIVRAKYNELTRKGMSEQQAIVETDKWVSRLMGDRSLGQQPLLFNSKMLGLVTKFQLEVRNNLDSMFYDTIQDAKVSNEEIVNAKERNAKTAAKITSTLVQTAVATHLFGKAFEAVAGYNPSFDIVSVLATLFGFDDEEDSEDTALDNMEQAFLELLEDLPYTSTLTGGRIPIGSALPIEQFITGKDRYGNEKSRVETITEVAPYYLLPGGYGQIKKTTQGLGMFSEDHPIAGSYTDSGNLRFPVEDNLLNRTQAALFGQYASENARDYFDNNRTALKEKQIQEFIDVDIPIRDYWEYREGLSEQKTIEDKFDYIAGLDLPVSKKNILINNIVDREEAVDLEGYEDFSSYEEFDFATKNPEKYTVAKAVGGFNSYVTYYEAMNDISADKDASGKSITGSRKEKIIDYVNSLDIDYGMKIILFKSEYKADDTYNYDILDYLNSRDDLTYEEIVTILTELDFTVDAQGNVYWD